MNVIKPYKEIEIQIDSIKLKGNLRLAENSKGIIVFSHGSGSSRLSSRNNYVADLLLQRDFSSLLFDLLTRQEDLIYENRFNIGLLTNRLIRVTELLVNYDQIKDLPIGYFGASTGAASALSAASQLGSSIKAIVSRGGRPDLAMNKLKNINIPTLLLVGGNDDIVIELIKKAQAEIKGICELKILEGASHLFEEPGKLDIVAIETGNWFNKYLN
jgi:pimeloyl-ACP methyl ester carboxylesterase